MTKRFYEILLVALVTLLLPAIVFATGHITFIVKGVDETINKNITTRLESEQKLIGERPDSATVNSFYKNTDIMVHDAITPYGYFTPQISSSLKSVKSQWIMTYRITLGQPVKIKAVNVSTSGVGQNNLNLQMYLADFPLKPDMIFTAESYETAKARILEIANNQGYIKADFTESDVLVDTDKLTAVVNLHLETGERYYFGKLTFNDSPFSEEFLQRFNVFGPKAPFSSNRLIRYQQRMNDSTYFSQVIVLPDFQHPTADHRIPVHVSVSTPKAHRYTLGIGYGTFTGPRLTAGATFRHLTDTGQSLDAQLKLSSVLSGLATKYYIPGKHPLNDQWMIGTSFQKFTPKNGESTSRSIMGGYNYKSQRWQWTANLNWLFERYKIDTNNLPTTDSVILYPNLNISYVKADDVISPNTAKSFSVNLQGASQNILSSTSFMQSEVRGKLFFTPIEWAHIVLRADLGYTVVHDINDLPLSLRFFAGGINSIRGYPDSSIGPGKYLGTASVEYRNHITENWVGAVFYDTGTATDHIGTPLNNGVGIGVIYESVIGPLRVYVARAISKPDHPYQVEFNVGPEF